MDIIARFPRLRPLDDEATARPCAPAQRPAPRPRQPFPTVSVAALAVVAAVAWSLAAWHESVRFASQQRPERLALEPPSAALPAAVTPTP
ncbi:MAG: hypothetical protein ACKOOF_04420 [Planctomycetaceae bacterium]